jgi:hypothetical protein
VTASRRWCVRSGTSSRSRDGTVAGGGDSDVPAAWRSTRSAVTNRGPVGSGGAVPHQSSPTSISSVRRTRGPRCPGRPAGQRGAVGPSPSGLAGAVRPYSDLVTQRRSCGGGPGSAASAPVRRMALPSSSTS